MKVVVLGAGVVGVASAYYLAKAGHAVTVLDRAGSIVIEARGSKLSVADEILSVLAERLLADGHRTPSEFPGAP